MSIRVTREGAVATVVLDRPEKLNALDADMHRDLTRACAELDADEAVRAVVLTGAGRAFCAGGDVTGMGPRDVVAGRARSRSHQRTVLALYNLEKPVVAAVRGAAAGFGMSLALACDLVVASESAYFLAAFKNVGIPPDGGAVYFLARHLGIARAKEIVYSARRVGAHEARELGIVAKVVPEEALEAEAQGLARELAASATHALVLAKKMFQFMCVPTLEMLLELEALAVGSARLTHDHAEGVAAFKEKRPPKFLGR